MTVKRPRQWGTWFKGYLPPEQMMGYLLRSMLSRGISVDMLGHELEFKYVYRPATERTPFSDPTDEFTAMKVTYYKDETVEGI